MAQKAMQTAEAESIATRIQDLQAAYEEQLAADASEKKSVSEFDLLAQSTTVKSRDELLQLMYQGLDRVIVNVDGSLDVQWKFEEAFEKKALSR